MFCLNAWNAIAGALRWGVALVRIILCSALLTLSWDSFQVQGVYRETVLQRGRDCEGGRHVALVTFIKNVLYKRILINSFGLLYK